MTFSFLGDSIFRLLTVYALLNAFLSVDCTTGTHPKALSDKKCPYSALIGIISVNYMF